MTAVKLSSLNPLLHLHSCLFVLHSLTFCPVFALPGKQPSPPFPTLRFSPQRWRADSYNYPSVCEMNHWVADWAAWWETSILSGTTECAQASPSSLCSCPGLARTCSPPLLRKQGCGLQPVCAVAEDLWQRHVLIKNTSAEIGWNSETWWCNIAWADATWGSFVFYTIIKTTSCAWVTSSSY